MIDMELLRKIDRIHPYPAKYPIDMAVEYISKYTVKGQTVYDPFLGSGTTLLASSILGRKGYGTDINYIAILISKFKLLSLTEEEIQHLTEFIDDFENNYQNAIKNVELYYYQSIDHWFCEDAIKVLSLIRSLINNICNKNENIFCKLVMSTIVNTVSNQDSDTRYAAVYKPNINIDYVADTFIKKFRSILSLFIEYNNMSRLCEENMAILLDSKKCTDFILNESIDMIMTSPPYINTYDYYLYHKHRMNWLDYDVKYSMNTEIGSRREFSSLKKPESKFNEDLLEIFEQCNKLLKPNGKVVIVIGDGRVAGKKYDAKENMLNLSKKIGWELIDYSYTNLDDTSRSFRQSYRTKGKKEHILVFSKKEFL